MCQVILTAPLSGKIFSSACWDLAPLSYRPNLKFLTTAIIKIWEAVQNVQIGVVWALRGHSRSSAMSPFDRAHDFIFDFNRNHASILYRFGDIASYMYLSKVADFNPPCLQLTSPLGVTLVEFRGDLWYQKNLSPWAIKCTRDKGVYTIDVPVIAW